MSGWLLSKYSLSCVGRHRGGLHSIREFPITVQDIHVRFVGDFKFAHGCKEDKV